MFEKFLFSQKQVMRYHKAAARDLSIAQRAKESEVTFRFAYDALLKTAILICAQQGLRVHSRQGHHTELINKLSEILKDADIRSIGQEMREKRNWDLYSGGIIVSYKEAKEYLEWVERTVRKAEKYIAEAKKR